MVIGDERPELIGTVPGGEEVVQPEFLAVLAAREIGEGNLGTPELEDTGQAPQGAVDLALEHDVGVEGDHRLSTIERHVLPVGNGDQAVRLITADRKSTRLNSSHL